MGRRTANDAGIDLIAPKSFANGQPHEQFRWLRANDPVHFHEEPNGRGFWAITRYSDVQVVSRDPRTYSSWLGGVMVPDSDPATLEGSRLMMLFQDAPAHTRHRRLVSRAFTPRASAVWGDRIQALASQIVDSVIERGECDLVADVAGEMPSYVIAELMGIPPRDSPPHGRDRHPDAGPRIVRAADQARFQFHRRAEGPPGALHPRCSTGLTSTAIA